MRICCRKCKTIWDQEEKECLFCKTWHAPLFICSNCGDGVSDESKRACPRCKQPPTEREIPRGKERCMKCGRESTSNGGPDKTYFVPITFCQKCGGRENCFEFKDLK